MRSDALTLTRTYKTLSSDFYLATSILTAVLVVICRISSSSSSSRSSTSSCRSIKSDKQIQKNIIVIVAAAAVTFLDSNNKLGCKRPIFYDSHDFIGRILMVEFGNQLAAL